MESLREYFLEILIHNIKIDVTNLIYSKLSEYKSTSEKLDKNVIFTDENSFLITRFELQIPTHY